MVDLDSPGLGHATRTVGCRPCLHNDELQQHVDVVRTDRDARPRYGATALFLVRMMFLV